MEMHKKIQNATYILMCFVLPLFLSSCKGGSKVTVFDGLPESTYVTQMKTAIENKTPLAVSFTAEWCPHCQKYKPVFFEVKELYKDKVLFINIDVDDKSGSELSNRFQVRGIPTTAFVRADGSVLQVKVGEVDKEELIKIAEELMVNRKKKRGEAVAPFPIEPTKEDKAAEPAKDDGTAPQEIIKEESLEEPEEDVESAEEKNDEPAAVDTEQAIPQEETKPSESKEDEPNADVVLPESD